MPLRVIEVAELNLIREHHWSPSVIGGLFLDDLDKYGLFYLNNDILKMHEETKQKK